MIFAEFITASRHPLLDAMCPAETSHGSNKRALIEQQMYDDEWSELWF
jgi:hypothetical protein